MRLITNFTLILFSIWICIACDKDNDYHYPSVSTDLVVLNTNSKSEVGNMVIDDGTTYTPYNTVSTTKADSSYRARCTYLPISTANDGIYDAARIYSVAIVLSPHPVLPSHFPSGLKTAPVNIGSVWCSGGYINLHLNVLTKEKAHAFHFIRTKTGKTTTGNQRFSLLLYHDRGEDEEAFTREVYLSCPLQSLSPTKGDSIYFTIHTYDGDKCYPFAY